jgi:hypothetical protein
MIRKGFKNSFFEKLFIQKIWNALVVKQVFVIFWLVLVLDRLKTMHLLSDGRVLPWTLLPD